MRILIIGGTGFIGRFLVGRLLPAGHDVSVVRRPDSTAELPRGVRFIGADRRRLAASVEELRAFRPDVVVDLILSSGRQGSELMDTFRGHTQRVVAITSMDVYRAAGVLHGSDEGPLQPVPLDEDAALRTTSQTYPAAQLEWLKGVFGWLDDEYDKVSVERAVRGDPDLPATVLRLPMIYGPGDQLHRFFPLIKRMDDRRPAIPMATRMAAWRGTRGYVENVAAAIALAVTSERAAGRVYNVGEAESHTELEWARCVAGAAGYGGELAVLRDEDMPPSMRPAGRLEQHWVSDTSRLRTELGYEEPVDRDEAMRRTVEWERTHSPPIDPAQYDYAAEDEALKSPRVSPAASVGAG
jgi:nucleoside-diphosphate-sugar epimerase